jgi:hypothetical protein
MHLCPRRLLCSYLQKTSRGIRNAYKHGTPVVDDEFEFASERHGSDGIDARA